MGAYPGFMITVSACVKSPITLLAAPKSSRIGRDSSVRIRMLSGAMSR